MNDLFLIRLELEDVKENDNLRAGVLQITPNENIEIERIKGKLRQKIKGKIASQNRLIDTFGLSIEPMELSKNQLYDFPFNVEQKSDISTYKGENVHIFYEIEFSIQLEEESFKRLDKSLIESIKSFVTDGTNYRYSGEVIYRKPENYDIIEGLASLKNHSSHTISRIFSVGTFLIPFLIAFSVLEAWGFLAIFVVFAIIILLYIFRIVFIMNVLGQFNIDIQKKNNNSFVSTMHSKNNWKYVREANLYYEIIEQVTDDRGNGSSTYTEILYESDNIPIPMKNSREEIIHQFPTPDSVPPIINIPNVSIRWVLVLEIVTKMNLTLNYTQSDIRILEHVNFCKILIFIEIITSITNFNL